MIDYHTDIWLSSVGVYSYSLSYDMCFSFNSGVGERAFLFDFVFYKILFAEKRKLMKKIREKEKRKKKKKAKYNNSK